MIKKAQLFVLAIKTKQRIQYRALNNTLNSVKNNSTLTGIDL